ncbi:hypothetical protein ACROYT_G011489 [Oculina patagonica]
MNKVAAPVLRDFIKQGMDMYYVNNTYCHGLTAPCSLKTLTYPHVNADLNLRRLKFQNINNNLHNHGNRKNLYNYNINTSVDLAKLFLPDYLAEFSAFDESLDMSAILRLLGFKNPAPIFPSPNPLISIQTSADDVRENVRNKWGHCNVTDWTEAFFNDCFFKLETLVKSLGLTAGMEKTTLDQLLDWQTKGCHLVMGHALDKTLLSLVQIEVKRMITDLTLQSAQLSKVQGTVSALQDQLSLEIARLNEHDARLDALEKELQEDMESRRKEVDGILERLVSTEKTLSELLKRVQGVEEGLAATNVKVEKQGLGLAKTDDEVERLKEGFAKTVDRVERLKDGFTKTDDRVERLEEGFAKRDDKVERLEEGVTKTDDRVERLEEGFAKTDVKVKQLEREVKGQRMKDLNPERSPVKSFDVGACRRKLADHYKRAATVPTSVWSKKSLVDIHQIYTRLSWVKEEQSPAGSSNSELSHYTDVFTANKKGVVPKRILVQGQTGIGKSTFVKKLSVDWAELDDEKIKAEQGRLKDEENSSEDKEETSQYESLSSEDYEGTSSESVANTSGNQEDALKKFEILLVINLKEVSKCQNLPDIISHSHIFPEEETALTEGLLSYITKNQEKVLLVFDGYDEYRCGSNSDIYQIFRGNKLRNCCVLITTRISKGGELREFKDVQAEITGFSEEDKEAFMTKMLGGKAKTRELIATLSWKKLTDLAKVPLLLLFFCTLWKRGKFESFPDTKTELYTEIVQCVLDYSQGKRSPAHFGKVEDYKDILAEIGKVALECLLKSDHAFEYDQLPDTILSDESVIIGLLQVTEDSENQRPAGMVSFFHKSIQEFLAAWYITYRCVPEESLGGIEQHAGTLEDCQALENVFQFVCGLSKNGAVQVSKHLTSVRISDPTLDLSKAVPFVENETDAIRLPCGINYMRHKRFGDFVVNCFREVHSKAEFVTHCSHCTGGYILDTYPLKEHAPKFQFYILTDLDLGRDNHATLFTETTTISNPCHSSSLHPEQLCLKFLRTLCCRNSLSSQTMKDLGTMIRICDHLNSIEFIDSDDTICDLLEQIPKPSTCSLKIGRRHGGTCILTSAGAETLAGLLPRFNNVISLHLGLNDCSDCCSSGQTGSKYCAQNSKGTVNMRNTPDSYGSHGSRSDTS